MIRNVGYRPISSRSKGKLVHHKNFTGSKNIDTRFSRDSYPFLYRSVKEQLEDSPNIKQDKFNSFSEKCLYSPKDMKHYLKTQRNSGLMNTLKISYTNHIKGESSGLKEESKSKDKNWKEMQDHIKKLEQRIKSIERKEVQPELDSKSNSFKQQKSPKKIDIKLRPKDTQNLYQNQKAKEDYKPHMNFENDEDLKLQVKEDQRKLNENLQKIEEERSKLEKEKVKIEKEKAKIEDAKAQIEVEKAKINTEKAKLKEERLLKIEEAEDIREQHKIQNENEEIERKTKQQFEIEQRKRDEEDQKEELKRRKLEEDKRRQEEEKRRRDEEEFRKQEEIQRDEYRRLQEENRRKEDEDQRRRDEEAKRKSERMQEELNEKERVENGKVADKINILKRLGMNFDKEMNEGNFNTNEKDLKVDTLLKKAISNASLSDIPINSIEKIINIDPSLLSLITPEEEIEDIKKLVNSIIDELDSKNIKVPKIENQFLRDRLLKDHSK